MSGRVFVCEGVSVLIFEFEIVPIVVILVSNFISTIFLLLFGIVPKIWYFLG